MQDLAFPSARMQFRALGPNRLQMGQSGPEVIRLNGFLAMTYHSQRDPMVQDPVH